MDRALKVGFVHPSHTSAVVAFTARIMREIAEVVGTVGSTLEFAGLNIALLYNID